jgi:MFS family permease
MGRGSSLILRGNRLPFFCGWLLVAVGFITMAVGVNARTAFSLLFPQILNEFGWDRGVTAGAFSFGFLVSAVVTPCVGWLTDRRGPRLVIAPLLFRRDGDCHETQERHQEQRYSMH